MKKTKVNPHCPVPGCKTKQPHLSDPATAAHHNVFSKPELLAESVRLAIHELGWSAIDDVNNRRFFASVQ
jgi:hypothetical protein